MRLRPSLLLLMTGLLFWQKVEAQRGFSFTDDRSEVEIPFEFQNNFIVVTLLMNHAYGMKFIFDTGSEHTIITKREVPDLLGLRYEREFKLLGSDLTTELTAYLVRGIRFEVPEKIVAVNESVLVLDTDYFRFEEYAGVAVQGILGANVFSKYLIRVNYQRHVISLIDRGSFKKPPGFEALEIQNFRNKPYLSTNLRLQNDSLIEVKLLLDTGAGHGLMLFTNTHPSLTLPPEVLHGNIGMGLGGYLEGFLGRTSGLFFGKNELSQLLTYFQAIDTVRAGGQLNNRNGLIGNDILSRFQVIFDLNGEMLYLKPAKNWQKKFDYDRSGISVVASGANLRQFSVQEILPNSPASDASLQKGDRILRIGPWPVSVFSLASLQKKLVGKPGQDIKLTIRRGTKKMSVKIALRDLI